MWCTVIVYNCHFSIPLSLHVINVCLFDVYINYHPCLSIHLLEHVHVVHTVQYGNVHSSVTMLSLLLNAPHLMMQSVFWLQFVCNLGFITCGLGRHSLINLWWISSLCRSAYRMTPPSTRWRPWKHASETWRSSSHEGTDSSVSSAW